jgi:hypothetical protein
MARKCGLLGGWLIAVLGAAGFSGSLGVSAQAADTSKYVYALIFFVLALILGIVVWWWTGRQSRPKEVLQRVAEVPVAKVADDLTRIEGIGPKISGLLQQAGISTFADLAGTGVERLQGIIAAAGLTALADPASWPEQASLAAQGQWERLQALQDELKGGRRE